MQRSIALTPEEARRLGIAIDDTLRVIKEDRSLRALEQVDADTERLKPYVIAVSEQAERTEIHEDIPKPTTKASGGKK